MQKFNKAAQKIQVLSNKVAVTKLEALVIGDAAAALIDKLVYGTKLANDHVLHELEARYGAVMAQYLMEPYAEVMLNLLHAPVRQSRI